MVSHSARRMSHPQRYTHHGSLLRRALCGLPGRMPCRLLVILRLRGGGYRQSGLLDAHDHQRKEDILEVCEIYGEPLRSNMLSRARDQPVATKKERKKKLNLSTASHPSSHFNAKFLHSALPWSCATASFRPAETDCILTTTAGYLAFNKAETSLSPIYAYGVTVSLAVRDAVAYTSISPNYETTYVGEGKPTTVWCDNEYCMGAFDTPMTSIYSYPYATATSGDTATSAGPSVPQPPEKMGQLSPLAIVAITGLAGALLLSLALLSPFVGEYQRRKKRQSPSGAVNTR
ncbi:hypothetical protein BDP81DRAFT_100940 [Colletotrichum phormii]|uniref:Uncharacterized protein n=1 Tax=Colletotrichum phormii TaxID=359342 RepID=A0AAJ0ED57_9PEZI|nr:uncharacterized protein BDP81DRAFT_100940 [Colletotrichum phormii]KAK1625262.1 hypothetical protein BDP81DRAFT_100940 [Colletotrichum phormii]